MDSLRISTMTACAEIRSNIDLSKLYEQTHLSDFIKYVEHGDNNYKGLAKKNTKKKRKEKSKRTFFNQVTLHCFYDDKLVCHKDNKLRSINLDGHSSIHSEGIYYIQADHEGNSQKSIEETDIVQKLVKD